MMATAAGRAHAAAAAPYREQYAAWERDGYGAARHCAARFMRNAATRYEGSSVPTMRGQRVVHEHEDIYDATLSPRPAHGPCGMVQLYHHATLWALRQHPAVCVPSWGTARRAVRDATAPFQASAERRTRPVRRRSGT